MSCSERLSLCAVCVTLFIAGCDPTPGARASPQGLLAVDLVAPRETSFTTAQGHLAHIERVIGSVEGPDDIFGAIADALYVQERGFLVLDGQSLRLSWYDEGGALKAQTGGAGGGPGALRYPSAIVVVDDSTVLVTDQVYPKWVEYAWSRDTLQYHRDVRLPFPVTGACSLHGRVYVTTSMAAHVIHEVNGDGVVMASFGDRIGPPSDEPPFNPAVEAIVAEQRNLASIYCLDDQRLVVVMFRERPIIIAFDGEGAEVWRTEIPQFRAVARRLGSDGRGIVSAPDPQTATMHHGVELVESGNQIIVTLLETGWVMGARGPEILDVPEVRFLAPNDGHQVGSIRPFPAVVASIDGGKTLGYVNSPVPRARLFEGVPDLPQQGAGRHVP